MSPEIRLTPPRRARRRMAGLAGDLGCCLVRCFGDALLPPFASPFPPLPRPDMWKCGGGVYWGYWVVRPHARYTAQFRMWNCEWLTVGFSESWSNSYESSWCFEPRMARGRTTTPQASTLWGRNLSRPIRAHFLIHVVDKLQLTKVFQKVEPTLILAGIQEYCGCIWSEDCKNVFFCLWCVYQDMRNVVENV
jgi:hypothetical protein